eukprot:jgi/Antlo1/1553/1309
MFTKLIPADTVLKTTIIEFERISFSMNRATRKSKRAQDAPSKKSFADSIGWFFFKLRSDEATSTSDTNSGTETKKEFSVLFTSQLNVHSEITNAVGVIFDASTGMCIPGGRCA